MWINDGYKIVEYETFTCAHSHCGQRVVVVPHKCRPEDAGGLCLSCMRLICSDCVGKSCTPIEGWVERQEARGRMLRDMGYIE